MLLEPSLQGALRWKRSDKLPHHVVALGATRQPHFQALDNGPFTPGRPSYRFSREPHYLVFVQVALQT